MTTAPETGLRPPSGHDPSATLLWCTGRIPLPGLPRREDRQWDGSGRQAPVRA